MSDTTAVSQTARIVAHYRTFSDIPFANEVAERIGANAAFDALVQQHGLDRAALSFYAPMFEARCKSITAAVANSGLSQAIELASGFTFRGIGLAGQGIRTIETDLPGIVAIKRSLFSDRPGYSIREADALDPASVLAAAADLRAEPVVVVVEGLANYLDRTEVDRLLGSIRALLDRYGGFAITPDFSYRADLRGIPADRMRLREVISGMTARDFDRTLFEDEAELRAFLADRGFSMQVSSQLDGIELVSPERIGLPREVVSRLSARMRLFRLERAAA